MILVDGEKYSCVQCIRGHRSSTCKHSARPLVQVRSRGRPSLNAGHRIAVTESELVLSRNQVTIQDSVNTKSRKSSPNPIKESIKKPDQKKSSCCSSKNNTNNTIEKPQPTQSTSSCCASKNKSPPTVENNQQQQDQQPGKPCCSTTHSECGCGKNGVIMLRASKRQFVDVRNGNIDYVGPYNESSLNKFKIGMSNTTQPPAKKAKHIRNSSCCSAASASASNKLKVLKQIKMNEFDYQIPRHLSNFEFPGQNNQIPNQPPHLQHYPQQQYQPYQQQAYPPPQNHISRDHLAIGLPFSMTERPQQDQEYQQYQQQVRPIQSHFHSRSDFDQAFQEYQSQSRAATTQPTTTTISSEPQQDHYQYPQPLQPQPQQKIYDVVYSSGCADECSCGPDCTCPGCLIHRTNEELKEYGILDTSTSSTPSEGPLPVPAPPNSNQPHVGYDLINLETIDEMLLREMFEEECYCKPDECCCYNCSKHGISEGIRLSDGVRVAEADGELDFGKDRSVTPNSHQTVSACSNWKSEACKSQGPDIPENGVQL